LFSVQNLLARNFKEHAMMRKLFCALSALVVCAGLSLADEVKGKVKSVDVEKNTIVVTVGDKDQTFTLSDDTKIVNSKGKDVKDKAKAIKGIKPDTELTITTEKKDDKDVVTKVQLPAKKSNK